jgi:hypothetical protein|tara:strand:- start:9 stop:731 length:723 start_codon:yes stop_codon:yes gene_type:complete
MSELNLPTEIVELPSKGVIYPKDHPLKEGKVEIKYMTAKEEDILTNQNFIQKGIVLDKLLESVVITPHALDDIHPGDKNAIMVSSRILGYGKDYSFNYDDVEYNVDLSTLENKSFDSSAFDSQGNFTFILPQSQIEIKAKLLTSKDLDSIEKELEGLKKSKINTGGEVTTRLRHSIISVDGITDKTELKNFINNNLLAQDSRALRVYTKDISPDVDMVYQLPNGEKIDIPIMLNFFWPDL